MSGFAFPLVCTREVIKLRRRTLRCYKDWDEYWADTATNVLMPFSSFCLPQHMAHRSLTIFSYLHHSIKMRPAIMHFKVKYKWLLGLLFWIIYGMTSFFLNSSHLIMEKWQYYNLLSGKMLALYSFIYRYFVCVCLVFTIVVGAVGDSETLCKMALLYSSWYWRYGKIN